MVHLDYRCDQKLDKDLKMEELLRDKLNKRMDIVTKMAFQTETKLKGYPEGRIKISKRGKNTYYYQISNRTNLKLLKNTDRKIIDKLIQKRYLEKVLDAFKTGNAAKVVKDITSKE